MKWNIFLICIELTVHALVQVESGLKVHALETNFMYAYAQYVL